jgi:hypothetical protein
MACQTEFDLAPPTVDDDPTLPALEWNGSRFHIEQSGAQNGVPVIFLAGAPRPRSKLESLDCCNRF